MCKLLTYNILLFFILLLSLQSFGQSVPKKTENIISANEKAQNVFRRTLDKYNNLKTYQDKVTVHAESDAQNTGDIKYDSVYDFSFAAPNKFALRNFYGNSVVSDGEKITNQAIYSGRYTQDLISLIPKGENIAGFNGSIIELFHPVADILINRKRRVEDFLKISKVVSVKSENYRGETGKTVEVLANYSFGGIKDPVPINIWFRDKTGLIGRFYVDMSTATAKTTNAPVTKNFIEIVFEDVVINSPIKDSEFIFKPRAIDKKVASFAPSEQAIPNVDDGTAKFLIGKKAPEAQAFDMDGKAIRLADFKGKVVVLEFWATWCRGCNMMLQYIKKVKENFADRDDVVILGVNIDDPADNAKVKKYLKEKNLKFRSFRDGESRISSNYRVVGTPTIAVIDKNGVLRDIRAIGGNAEMVKRYTEIINKLVEEN